MISSPAPATLLPAVSLGYSFTRPRFVETSDSRAPFLIPKGELTAPRRYAARVPANGPLAQHAVSPKLEPSQPARPTVAWRFPVIFYFIFLFPHPRPLRQRLDREPQPLGGKRALGPIHLPPSLYVCVSLGVSPLSFKHGLFTPLSLAVHAPSYSTPRHLHNVLLTPNPTGVQIIGMIGLRKIGIGALLPRWWSIIVQGWDG